METKNEIATDQIGKRGYPRHYQALGLQPPMREVPITDPKNDPGTPPDLPPTQSDFKNAIQFHIDSTSVSKNYSDGNALAGYVNSTVPQWSAEATAFVAWRDQVWIYAYAELDKALNGEREIPTVEDFIAELPVITWPS